MSAFVAVELFGPAGPNHGEMSMQIRNRVLVTGAAVMALSALQAGVAPRPARACGGFFCQQTPIDQSGEYILFSIGEGGTTAYIQIQYQGKAEDFAWVVPVLTAPRRVGVGVQQVFTSIMAQTAPQFRINWDLGSQCSGPVAFSPSDGGVSDARTGAGVSVLDQGEVGPYNYVVVSAKESAKLKLWLDENGFVQPARAEAPLKHYVDQGFVFVAIKLKRGAEVGEIQPLILEMGHAEACVPLVLTRIAAVPDMPIYAMVLGKHRAVPRNWFQVEVNPKKLDWFRNGQNYRKVVTDAIDEAAGRGFVTEYAGDTLRFRQTLYTPGQYDLKKLNGMTQPVPFVEVMLQLGLPRDPLIQTLLRQHIPMPAAVRQRGVVEAAFYNNLRAYEADLVGQKFDPAAFIRDLDERIVQPMIAAQKMLDDQPYFTRLFTTVSPDEMTRDPLFDFNPDLEKVSNVHVANATGMCNSNGMVSDVTLTFENGERQTIPGSFQPFNGPPAAVYAQGEPSSRRVQLIGPSGQPIDIARKRVAMVDQQLATLDPKLVREMALVEAQQDPEPASPTQPPSGPPPAREAQPAVRKSGCAAGGAGGGGDSGAGFMVLALAGVAAVVRRRRRRLR